MGGSGSVEALVPGLDLRPALAEVLASARRLMSGRR